MRYFAATKLKMDSNVLFVFVVVVHIGKMRVAVDHGLVLMEVRMRFLSI